MEDQPSTSKCQSPPKSWDSVDAESFKSKSPSKTWNSTGEDQPSTSKCRNSTKVWRTNQDRVPGFKIEPSKHDRTNPLAKWLSELKACPCHERDILMHRRGAEAEASGIRLQYPLSRLSLLPRLQYLCRLSIRLVARREQLSTLPLPPKLLAYVADPKYLIPDIKECLRVLEDRKQRLVTISSDYAEI
ncbi:hypothetical protein Q1695_008270 [Nippostrongylus brasiliensis]|nr:hypothetical protein Q1695_008270 [Nippostrongylus brasiliensis]